MPENTARTITATATKSGDWWVLTVPELDTTTMVRRLTSADEQVAALAATQLDLDPANIAVHIERPMPAEAAEQWQRYREATERTEQARLDATGHRERAVMQLAEAGYVPGDIAGFTGLSSSRINQIIRDAGKEAPSKGASEDFTTGETGTGTAAAQQ